ncbi:FH1/FH2 domain-containing protein 3 isoform X3 [Agrilus planipennis]|uniref:FH1/FH2 domain-containing protein 3 isoform X3 n=1 Tax=Agrilus planipennis TaxID=224129 RepID=A0A1W4WSX8_AGRPL|nr:FH1/FH2 domain-containing protein 3 isoform X3 [Agrilus planipennis]
MSSYKKYSSPWLKGPSYDSSSSKSDTSTSKFGSSSYLKSSKRTPSDLKDTPQVKYKYGSNTSSTNTSSSNPGSTYQRDKSSTRDGVISGKQYGKSDLASRFKSAIEKKDTLHVPSVSYRPLNRTETKSRDPSVERDNSSNSSYGYRSVYSPGASRSLRSPISRERSKDDLTYTYRTSSTNSSKEDVSNIANKYITSRFLPKNTIEKSHTAYIRPVSSRLASSQRETSRKNRELLNLLHVQQQNDKCSGLEKPSTYTDSKYVSNDNKSNVEEKRNNVLQINVISRGTSPTFPNPTQLLNSRRIDMTRLVEKQILRPISPKISVADKQTQFEQLEDSCRINQSRLHYSDHSKPVYKSQRKKGDTPSTDSSKTPSRSSSTKSMISVKSEKAKDSKSSDENKSAKSTINDNKKQLPPCTANSKTQLNLPNKDFRKSVLNMNSDVKSTKNKIGKRTESVSSVESEPNLETNVGSNMKFMKKGSPGSKLPKPFNITDSKNINSTRSGGTTSEGSSYSGNEEDGAEKKGNSQVSNYSSSSDNEKVSKPPINPKIRNENGPDSKSFLMRALAPVTSFFKQKYHDPSDKSELIGEDTTLWDIKTDVAYNSKYYDDKTIGSGVEEEEDSSIFENEREFSLNSANQNATINLNDKAYQPTTETEEVRHKITHIRSGERPWWLESNSDKEDVSDGGRIYNIKGTERIISEGKDGPSIYPDGPLNRSFDTTENLMTSEYSQKYKIRHIDSGERAWWLDSQENIPEGITKWETKVTDSPTENRISNGSIADEIVIPLGDRASPEGLENPSETNSGRATPYDNVLRRSEKNQRPQDLFISHHTNIDDILGGGNYSLSPLISRIFSYQGNESENQSFNDLSVSSGKSSWPPTHRNYRNSKLDDVAIQLYKDGDYGAYLDLDASISEQNEEFEGFQSNKKNSLVLRTQLSVRVHTIIEKLLTSEGRDLRRALFSLKQIFQEDKDLVHEFVQNDGLACLIKVGSEADQNYQNYILRALGQVMLYVDGMNGVIQHNETVQWLYSLISSKFRLVVKTALKLLLVFVEYTETNCMLLIKAVEIVDCSHGLQPWSNVMKLLKDFDSADTELLIYAMTLINKCFNGIPDQDTYYDQTDSLEEQGIEAIIQRYMSKPGTDLDLLQQFQIYEAVLQYEDDDEDKGIPLRHLDESFRKTLRNRKSVIESSERRKSRRHSTGTAPVHTSLSQTLRNHLETFNLSNNEDDDNDESSAGPEDVRLSGSCNIEKSKGGTYGNGQRLINGNIVNKIPNRKDLAYMNSVNKLDTEENSVGLMNKKPWILSMMYNGKKPPDEQQSYDNIEDIENVNENDRKTILQIKKENTVKDLTQKLSSQNILQSPTEEKVNRIGDMSGLISKAKEGLAKSKSNALIKSPTSESLPKLETKKTENELRWEELAKSLNRSLNLCDIDFTDLTSDDENDILAPALPATGIPPPPPPLITNMGIAIGAPPPPPLNNRISPPTPPNAPIFGSNIQKSSSKLTTESKIPIKKNKKTVKLFWKEVRDDPITSIKLKTGLIWDELTPVTVDTQKLEHLFESRAKDLITKEKQQELNKNKEIIVLDPKRSNAINIGMTKLPPPRSIKTAILKMDATIMNREGIEKLLTMLPTEEERTKIQEAQASNPDLPLGSAEQFLLTLASISELPARLKLWAFKLDFENTEREIAEPLMDLKQGIEILRMNKTFRGILSTLLSIGIFLNGTEVKGFQIEYLSKVPEVKDTVHKHSLLHHLCHILMEKFPEASDLYSEIGAITRASKIDFDELMLNIQRLEADCKASWDHLKLIAKHDGSTMMKVKMSDFLTDCAERIIILSIIHRRIINRFHKFLLWLGIPLHQIVDTKPNEFCKTISEFALEYRTTRERVLQQLEKKANHRERNKTRGKMITEIGKFRSKEDRADAELRQLLGSDISDVESLQGTLPWRRRGKDTRTSLLSQANGNLTDGDDEILESLVKTATKGPSSRTAPRERKRTRHADRKSLRRTLKNGLSEEEKKHLSTYIKSY